MNDEPTTTCEDLASGYREVDGVLRRGGVIHDDGTYDPRGFKVLFDMQRRHFWQRGRQSVVQRAVQRFVSVAARDGLSAIDLGGGCGGWVHYLAETNLLPGAELALGDSSLQALRFAKEVVSARVSLFQIDLLSLGWDARWDVAFMLDVLEHVPNDAAALAQVRSALKPGGLCFLTVPALRAFWSYNDEVVGHQRRYSRSDLVNLAARVGLEVVDVRYFMFSLSPFLWASRVGRSSMARRMTDEQKWRHIEKTHRVPASPVNEVLTRVLTLEASVGEAIRFPFGTSIVGVLRRPL
jgi:2-polyprenyl-3-methyl-5-hydroxy-6-metoxy-1,4-benzoquinol methylase